MEHALVVSRREPCAQLTGHLVRLGRGQRADAVEQRRQVLAVDELHRQEREALGFADVVDAAHVGVRDLAGVANLRSEPLERARHVQERTRQELDRDGLLELEVVGAIHHAHTPARQDSDDAVAPDQHLPGCELPTAER